MLRGSVTPSRTLPCGSPALAGGTLAGHSGGVGHAAGLLEICLVTMLLDWANLRLTPRSSGLFSRNSPASTRTGSWPQGEAGAHFTCPSLGRAHPEGICPWGIIRGPVASKVENLPWSWGSGCCYDTEAEQGKASLKALSRGSRIPAWAALQGKCVLARQKRLMRLAEETCPPLGAASSS